MKRGLWVAILVAGGCRGSYVVPEGDAASPFPTVAWQSITGTPQSIAKAEMPLVSTGSALVGFGGLPHTDTATWSFSLAASSWSSLPVTTPPAGRDGHCSAIFPSGNVLVTGGVTDAGPAPSMVLDGSTYTNVTSDRTSPGDGCVAAYLERTGTAIVYGGTTTPDATWAFDGTTWTMLAPPNTPGGRYGASVVVDPGEVIDGGTTDFIVMYGGMAGDVEADDVWIYNGTTWLELSTFADNDDDDTFQPRPDGRTGAAVAMDPVRRTLYVFGGKREGIYLNDLWALDMASSRWSQLLLTSDDAGVNDRPTGRAFSSVAYDTVHDRMLVFGGQGDLGLLADGWALDVSH